MLAAWRLLRTILDHIASPQHAGRMSIPTFHGPQSPNEYTTTGTVVHCANEFPNTPWGSILPTSLAPIDNDIARLGDESNAEKPYLVKTKPSSSPRYQRAKSVCMRRFTFTPEMALGCARLEVSIPPNYHEKPSLTHCWKAHIHPEGLTYYYNASHRVVTEANLRRPDILEMINHWIIEFETARDHTQFNLPPTYELLLELNSQEDGCNYYIVDHARQTIFYLDDANTECLDLPDVCSMDHLSLNLEAEYWLHLEYFCMHGTLPPSAASTIMGMLTHAWGDQTTSSLSTAPYNAEQCSGFMNVLDKLTVWQGYQTRYRSPQVEPGGICSEFVSRAIMRSIQVYWGPQTCLSDQDGYKTCIIARLMHEFLHSRFINLYGQQDVARLARNQSTSPESSQPDSKLLNALSVILLHQPKRELRALEDLWVDKIVYTEHWRTFLGAEMQEWRSISLLSTILLLVDTTLVVHLHALPGNWVGPLAAPQTGCIAGTMSLLLSMSAVVVGVTTVLIHQPYTQSHASDANAYLENASHETLGLQPLAIVLSLPRTLFLWGLVTAGIALLAFSFQLTDTWSMSFVGVFALLLCSLLFWAVRFLQVRQPGAANSSVFFARIPAAALGFFRRKNAVQLEDQPEKSA